jgi:uncharacterized protein (UPF0248 family)
MKFGKKAMVYGLLAIVLLLYINSCASLLLAGLIHDTITEGNDTEEKIVISLENKTNEILIIFLLAEFFPGNKKLWAQVARIPAHSIQEVRVSRGRTIRIIGGNSRIEYTDIECIDENFFTIYPQRNIPYVPENF